MHVTLKKVFGAGIDGDVTVTGPDFLIGRSPGCDLRPTCPRVSRVHCELIVRDGCVAVRDLNSTNGTFVNGERVATDRQLVHGDKLALGLCLFDVAFGSDEILVSEAEQVAPADNEGEMGATPAATRQEVGCLSV